jgi:glycosyltransferase involved in cell wall biosynthesis
MKVLLVNKFLYRKGGAETYVLNLGKILTDNGHTVEYFGTENQKNTVGNKSGLYVKNMDFGSGILKNILAPFRIIYSREAYKKILRLLYDFRPDVVHFNNIQFHLTPSMILAVQKYRKKTGSKVRIIYTAHDYQLICASHGLFDNNIQICEKCLGGNFTHCLRTKCVKNSYAKSFLGLIDSYFWKYSKAYDFIDTIICPSAFLKGKLDTQKRFCQKTVALHNFIEPKETSVYEKGDYVLEFGHLSRDKGTLTLLQAAKQMPQTKFLFAGYGAAEEEIAKVQNAEYVGFKTGEELKQLIGKALCSVYPSEWYENCPFSVIESQMYGTPVVASNMGGIPELIEEGKTGLLFKAGDYKDLESKLRYLLENKAVLDEFTRNCKAVKFETPQSYYEKILRIYGEDV